MGAGDKLTAKLARRTGACFIIRDANGQALAYVYFEGEPGRRAAAKLRSLPRLPRRFECLGSNCSIFGSSGSRDPVSVKLSLMDILKSEHPRADQRRQGDHDSKQSRSV
jgi:hypothetical protein